MEILKSISSKKKVGIIGAGPAGLCAAVRSQQCGHDVTVFEQTSKVGGIWVYTPEVNVHTSITNIPKEIMQFGGFPFPDMDNSRRSFVPSEFVLKYLEEFAKPVLSNILFCHKVVDVERHENLWQVQVHKLDDNQNPELTTFKFDVLFVCNGHHSKPMMPEFYEKYHKPWIHSHDYRSASKFNDQTVAIIGASFSGMDILDQLARAAKKVYLLDDKAIKFDSLLPENVLVKPRLKDATPDSLILSDDTSLSDIDTIIYCTGYVYNFPFFNSGNPLVEVLHNGKIVSKLFEHVAHVDYLNSLFFIGLHVTSTFFMIEYQVRFALALAANYTKGFNEEDVKDWEQKRLE
uniref:Flavin-containing monooxygenase n=1 Tax=Acrobeloides nanus TaxID=290746 RepID=A0A914D891_9BILA